MRAMRRPNSLPLALVPLIAVGACRMTPSTTLPSITYPPTNTVDQRDVFHGQTIADPYRWLEGDVRTEPEVAAWVKEQNLVTEAFLAALPGRESLRARLEALWNYERFSAPARHGDWYYFWMNDGLQPQSVLQRAKTSFGESQVVLDPNLWSKDGTLAYAGGEWSRNGRYLAYGISAAGSDWSTWRVLDLESLEHLGGQLEWIKFSAPAWKPDGSGFFYARYAAPEADAAFQASNLNQQVYFHAIGTTQDADRLIYERPDQPEWSFSPAIAQDGQNLILHIWKDGTPNLVHVLDLTIGRPPLELVASFTGTYGFVHGAGRRLLLAAQDEQTPRGALWAIDLDRPAREHWTLVIPAGAGSPRGTIEEISFVGGALAVRSLEDATTRLALYELDGRLRRRIELPGLGTATGFEADPLATESFFSFSSFATPPQVFHHDLASGATTLVRTTKAPIRPEDYRVEQVFYASKDGTRVPMFLVSRSGLRKNGQNPTLLYGYGGFNISLTPSFSPARIAWLDAGGLLAIPNLRGGGEYGEAWHLAGTKTKKQNVFDDFIAAAEWLIQERYTSPSHLAIQGGSNGGLLVGAVMCQRPELFGCCLPAVGVLDMLRFHLFTAGRYWVYDFGSVDDPEEFAALQAYSPYHNLKPGVCYPPTLITTADTDDRVVPGHSFKFAARLQAVQGCSNPTLIRIETSAGHGAGKPTAKLIEDSADIFAFTLAMLGRKATP
jgi:prolyl oligopeptidase